MIETQVLKFNIFETLSKDFIKKYTFEKKCSTSILLFYLIHSYVSYIFSIIVLIIIPNELLFFTWFLPSLVAAFILAVIVTKSANKAIEANDEKQDKFCNDVRNYCKNNNLYNYNLLIYLENKCNTYISKLEKEDSLLKDILIPISIPTITLLINEFSNYNLGKYGLYPFWVVIIIIILIFVMLFLRITKSIYDKNYNKEYRAYYVLADILAFLKAEVANKGEFETNNSMS